MLTRGTTLVSDAQVVQTQFLNDATSPPAGTVYNFGIAHKPDGTLYICNLPTTQGVFPRGKLTCRADGVLIVSSTGTRAAAEGPFALTGSGELLVSTGSPFTSRFAFAFDSTDHLVVSAVS